jgi:single-strand DNA-binding protein
MVNRVELLGNLTRPPELRYTGQGVPYCFIRLATNRYANGQQHTEYHFATAWHAQAERAAQMLTTGDRVFIEARLETNTTTREDGSREDRVRIVATRVLALAPRRTPQRGSESTGLEHIGDVIAETPEAMVAGDSGSEESS